MNIIKKVKEFNESGFPFYRLAWGIMLMDILVWGTNLIICLTLPFGMFLGHIGLYPFFSGLSILLLKISAIKDSALLIVLSVLPFVFKMICAIGIASKKRKFCFACVVLYLLDYISLLIYFVIGEIHYQDLVTTELLKLVFTTLWGSVVSTIFIGVYCCFYPGKLLKTEKIKIAKVAYPYLAVLLVIGISVFTGVYIKENKQRATDEEIKLASKCYEYSEQYLYEALPKDKATLEKMQGDIESVIETDVFKNAFYDSKFQERHMKVKADEEYVYFGAVTEKSQYANELIFLKCRILLELNKYDEYLSYYEANYKYFGGWTDKYYWYIQRNKNNFTDEQYEVIKTGYKKVLTSDSTDFEKYDVFAGLLWFNKPENEKMSVDTLKELLTDAEISEIYKSSFKNDDYIESEGFTKDMKKWTNIKDKFYMVN